MATYCHERQEQKEVMQPATSAYPPSLLQSRGSLILAACVFFLVFVSLKDYREENKSFLRSHGVEDETIEQAVPKTARERYAEQKVRVCEERSD